MATSDSVYKDVQFLCNKYHHGYITPDEFTRTFNTAQRIYLNRLFGQVQEYQNGRPVARTGGHMTEVVENKLSPFTKKVTVTITSNLANVRTQYTDFLKQLSLTTAAGVNVKRLKHEQVSAARSSVVDPPSSTTPYYYETADGFDVLSGADVITPMTMTYVRKPLDIVWNYTIVSGVPTYDPTGSVAPEWRDIDINDIIFIQLGLIGVNLKDQDLIRVSQIAKSNGE